MKVLILNGPPGCGKDTIAKLLCKMAPVLQGEFKEVLYEETAKLLRSIGSSFSDDPKDYSITTSDVRRSNEDRDSKEQPFVGGLSVRRWLQITSEMVVKKDKGQDYFGVAAADLWHSKGTDHVISDGGFIEEVDAVVDRFGVENVHVLRLYRAGFEFGTDTRKYIRGSTAQEWSVVLQAENPMDTVKHLYKLLTK
jgi:hypothetical protein